MFTGIIEAVGQVKSLQRVGEGAALAIATSWPAGTLAIGESLAVDGTCLTVIEEGDCHFRAELSDETLRLTTLGAIKMGDRVNLERALKVGDRLGGHWVTGHVDGIGIIRELIPGSGSVALAIEAPSALVPYFIHKGSVAVDGISLTLSVLPEDEKKAWFRVYIIPHTGVATALFDKKPGDRVNLEADCLSKIVAKMVAKTVESLLHSPGARYTDR